MNVILYCRVSTEEQTEGCSLDMQEKRLKDYCSRLNYYVIDTYREDYSAKDYTLKRPKMKFIYEYCKKHRNEVDKILFLRWDRFTRNVEFGMTFKRKFYDELGVEINAIENPIDFSVPEWSTLMPLYCGVAHTEDEKISKRTKDGMQGSRLKGKLMGKAPKGYKNIRVSKHDCWVAVDNAEAEKVKELFKEVAKGVEAPNLIRKRLYPNLSKTTFYRILTNRFYIGEIYIPAYDGFDERYITGQHDAIIDEQTFNCVQDILNGKRKGQPKLTKTAVPELYLRKFLVCPVCGHILTGAFSKGNGGRYPYYFCNHEHKHLNIRAEKVNEGFINFISSLEPNKDVLALYNEILDDVRSDNLKERERQINKLESELEKLKQRANRVRDLFYDGQISKEEKESTIERITKEMKSLETQIEEQRLINNPSFKEKIDYSINIIANMGKFFEQAPMEVRIKLLGSIFPEKIEFDGENYRTKSFNKMLDYIFQNTNQLQQKKTEIDSINQSQSEKGCPVGLEPTTFRTTI